MPVRTRSQKKEKPARRPITRSRTKSNPTPTDDETNTRQRRRRRAAPPKRSLKVKTNAKSNDNEEKEMGSHPVTPKKRRLTRKESALNTPPSKRQSRGVHSPRDSDSSGSNSPSKLLAADLDKLTVTNRTRASKGKAKSKPKNKSMHWSDALTADNKPKRDPDSENDSTRVNRGKKKASKPEPPTLQSMPLPSESKEDEEEEESVPVTVSKSRGARSKRTARRSSIVVVADSETETSVVRSAILRIQERLLTTEVQSAKDSGLIGREKEHEKIDSFLMNALRSRTGSSFYVCGSPGTGKTATLLNIMRKLNQNKKRYNMKSITKVNAMSLQTPQLVYSEIHRHIFGKQHSKLSPFEAARVLEGCFVGNATAKPTAMRVVIIDEMDGLLGKHQTVLYQLFEWCKRPNSALILIGIANSIDLTDRFLPRLRARKVQPELLIFTPYNATQLFNILQYRLSEVSSAPSDQDEKEEEQNLVVSTGLTYFDISALKLCSQKVAKLYGDVRKCLEVCRSALDILLKRCDELENKEDGDTNDTTAEQKLNKVGFREMQTILRTAFGSPLINVIRDLPNHQCIVVVVGTLLATSIQNHQKQSQNNATTTNSNNHSKSLVPNNSIKTQSKLTLHKLTTFYEFMSKKHSLPRTTTDEFYAIVDKLIAEGIFSVMSKRSGGVGGSKAKNVTILRPETELSLLVFEDDVSIAVENHAYLSKFFESHFVVPTRFRI